VEVRCEDIEVSERVKLLVGSHVVDEVRSPRFVWRLRMTGEPVEAAECLSV
jgi:hypothetical protein